MTKINLGSTIILTLLFAATTTANRVLATFSSYSLIENLSKETLISVPSTLQAETDKTKLPKEYKGACDVNPNFSANKII